ncbi:MAG: Minichromosome maintenance protein MCM [Candidatus Methanomethylicota archaeon]|nr:minichromosome maintenance protein MCM [Candidatus Culexmicrobium cathedralense]RLE48515.1 MAG: Minichromosome maintenance protein MCM [Candidatus Verstraetearchaeota archaeon]
MVIELIEQDPRERFANFFKSYQTPDGEYKYRKRLSQMAITGQKSLTVDFEDLMQFDHELAELLIEKPTRYLEAASYAVGDVMRIVNLNYAMKVREFKARFRRLPGLTPLRKIRAEHLGKLIMIEGILTRASSVKQQLVKGVFECPKCGTKMQIESKGEGERVSPPDRCSNPDCRSRGPFKLLLEESSFIDWQRLTIQEKPEELPPGQLPRSIDAIARGDIVDVARPGDRVIVVGVLKPRPEYSPRGRLTTYRPILEINSIDVSEKGLEEIEITPEDEEKIKELAKDPFIHQKIIQSIAPSIYGYEEIKEGIAYLLFGGVPKQLPDGVRIRGDINILLVGDPGTAKSQLLQYVARIAPRGIYTSGKGSTAAGLTAAVVRDKVTGDWYLEAGALVLADGGVACIDEIDKMRSEDRVAMHEAMEQQTVSIAKAGIVATLNARTAILAAANPALGRFVQQKSVAENVNLPVTILSRFDLIFPIIDRPSPTIDEKMSDHILKLHQTRGYVGAPPIPPDLLKKYISYARKYVVPRLTPEAAERIKKFYIEMRGKGSVGEKESIPITPRQLEALVRMAEARAKMALRDEVTVEDAEAAISLMTYVLERTAYDREAGIIDIDMIMTGKPRSQREKLMKLMDIIREKVREIGGAVSREEIVNAAVEEGLDRKFVETSIDRMLREGLLYEQRPGYIMPT